MPQWQNEGGGPDFLDTRKQGLEGRFRKGRDQSQRIIDSGCNDQVHVHGHARLAAERHREASDQGAW
jgi:hypothetical protein